jgi:hypothetical protein
VPQRMISVFLSLSGADSAFVESVYRRLPEGLAHYYPQTFTNGEQLIRAMEDRVGQSSIFVLFASKSSASSHWVNFEIERARVQSITRSNFRLFVFPIDTQVRRADLPTWMSEYWIPNAGLTTLDVARYIRNAVIVDSTAALPTGKGLGRGSFTDSAIQQLTQSIVNAGQAPNVLIFPGVVGIGRRTAAKQFLETGFHAARDLTRGPELSLPQFADLEDIYRALRQEIEPSFSVERFPPELEAFRQLGMNEQVNEVYRNLKHFFSLGQAVFAVTRNGIFQDGGYFKPWVPILFNTMSKDSSSKLCIISNRIAHENELRKHPNVLQFVVPALADDDIRSIIVAMLPIFGAIPVLPSDVTIRAIGGHPAIAKIASRLIARQGPTVFENDPHGLHLIQEDILGESLDVDALSIIEAEILSVLSWLPQLAANDLSELFVLRHGLSKPDVAICMNGLMLSCLVVSSGDNLTIGAPLRAYFRRHYGYGSQELRTALFENLNGTRRIRGRKPARNFLTHSFS